MKFDDTDLRIIRRLQRDARANFAAIAEECGVSVDTVIKRFQRLKRNNVVRGTTILLDPRKLGAGCPASMEISVDPPQANMVVEKMRRREGVAFCTPTIGDHNVFAVILLDTVEELNALRESVKNLPHVREVQTSLWVGDILLCPENFELEGLVKKHG